MVSPRDRSETRVVREFGASHERAVAALMKLLEGGSAGARLAAGHREAVIVDQTITAQAKENLTGADDSQSFYPTG